MFFSFIHLSCFGSFTKLQLISCVGGDIQGRLDEHLLIFFFFVLLPLVLFLEGLTAREFRSKMVTRDHSANHPLSRCVPHDFRFILNTPIIGLTVTNRKK